MVIANFNDIVLADCSIEVEDDINFAMLKI